MKDHFWVQLGWIISTMRFFLIENPCITKCIMIWSFFSLFGSQKHVIGGFVERKKSSLRDTFKPVLEFKRDQKWPNPYEFRKMWPLMVKNSPSWEYQVRVGPNNGPYWYTSLTSPDISGLLYTIVNDYMHLKSVRSFKRIGMQNNWIRKG